MIDHIGFPVSDYARSKALYLKALAPLDYTLVMEVTRSRPVTIPPLALAPTASLISGSAARADWTSRCTSRSWQRIAPPLTPFTKPPSPPAGATMARPGSARIIIRTITARSCSIPTATTSKPFATRRRNRFPPVRLSPWEGTTRHRRRCRSRSRNPEGAPGDRTVFGS